MPPLSSKLLLPLLTFFLSSVSAATANALTLPDWSEIRTISDERRGTIENEILKIVSKIESDGFVAKNTRFCMRKIDDVAQMEIWETALNASCLATAATAARHVWPPAWSDAGVSFTWIAYARLVHRYCAVQPKDPSCIALDKKNSRPRRPSALMLLLLPSFAEAETTPPCKVENNVMTTPKGQKIFIDFSIQPAKVQTDLLTRIATKPTDVQSQKDSLMALGRMGKPVLHSYRKKISTLTSQIVPDQIKWIATEKSPAELGDQQGVAYGLKFDTLRNQLIGQKISTTEAKDALTIGACPTAPVCMWLQNPSVRKTIKLLPGESDAQKTQALTFEQRAEAIFAELESLAAAGKLEAEVVPQIRRLYGNLLLAVEAPDARARNRARTLYGNRDASKAVLGIYDLVTETKKNEADRYREMANTALNQDGNGILSFGLSNQELIVSIVEMACSPPPEPAKRAPGKPLPRKKVDKTRR